MGPAAFTSPAPQSSVRPSMVTATLDIVTTAALLFVVATGLLVIFGVLKIINFAHGAFLTVGAYGALVTTAFGLNPWLSFPLAFVTGAVVGLLVERLVVRPLYDRPLDAILATWDSASSSASSSRSASAVRSSSRRVRSVARYRSSGRFIRLTDLSRWRSQSLSDLDSRR